MFFKPLEPFVGASLSDWNSWTWQIKNGLTKESDFAQHFQLTEDEKKGFTGSAYFQVRSTPYYVALSDRGNPLDPIRRMTLPTGQELVREGQQVPDPLGERQHSPGFRVIHRYPDRVLFLVTDQCSLYCRYCLRKHFTGQDQAFIGSKDYAQALNYLKGASHVREVILSGGDPLTLSDGRLEQVLSDLRSLEHIEIIRLATRMPVVCPMRVTPELIRMLKKFKPVFLITHFNHPQELSAEAAQALELFVDGGVPSFNQMVLLNGINNHPALIQALSRRLLFLRVKPYYMFQCDPSQGSDHFRISVEESLSIQRQLWGRLSGLAMPNLSLDIPSGGGKVGLVPDFQISQAEDSRTFRGWDGKEGVYENPAASLRLEPLVRDEYMSEWQRIQQLP